MHRVTFVIATIVATVAATYEEKRANHFHGGNVSQECLECICQAVCSVVSLRTTETGHQILTNEKQTSKVESGCSAVGCRFDKGAESCGYFQIKEPYYTDCGRPGPNWHTCADDLECSSRCVQAYMDRYIGYSGCQPTCESYARIHDGGPRGCADPATITYWHKIQSHGCT